MIGPSKEEYKDMTQRVVAKAKELADNAISNMYSNTDTKANFVITDVKRETKDNVTIAGPFYTTVQYDEYMNRYYQNNVKYSTKVSVKSLVDGSTATVLNKQGEVIDTAYDGEPFYIKVEGNDKYFVQIFIENSIKGLKSKVYSSEGGGRKYIVLEDKNIKIKDLTALTHNIETGYVDISFKDSFGDDISDVQYHILNDKDEIILDIDKYCINNVFALPIGNYYIQEYSAPNDCFLNFNKYEFNVANIEQTVKIQITNEAIYESFLFQ